MIRTFVSLSHQSLTRRMIKTCLLGAALVMLPLSGAHASPLSSSAASSLPSAPKMKDRGRTSAPFAFLSFCQRHGVECRSRGKGTRITLTPKTWATLNEVNRFYNRTIREVHDGRSLKTDLWSVPVSQGDCEDFAIIKRKALINKGFPSGALSLTVAKMRNGVGHAVLTVRTDRGDFVLDNRRSTIKPWNRVNYSWIKRQSAQHPKIWVAI